MKKLMFGLLAAIIAALTAPSAVAQNQIVLGGNTSGALAFVAEGGGNFSLNLCGKLNSSNKCKSGDTVVGPGTGQGIFSGNNGFYILSGTNTIQGTPTGCIGTTCTWSLSGGAWNFQFNTLKNGTGVDLLSGNLTLVSLTETPAGALFDETLAMTLDVTGGTLASLFSSSGGDVNLNVQTLTTKSLLTSPSGRGIKGTILSGDVTTTPEPGTMALLGSGFLVVGGYLRKKLRA